MTKAITINQNDISAEIYDLIYAQVKDKHLTDAEVTLVKGLFPKNADPTAISILDLGCGTARHIQPLLKLGYQVAGLDTSKGMLAVAAANINLPKIKIQDEFQKTEEQCQLICNMLQAAKFPAGQFDLIVLFWNAFNEIALTDSQARELLLECKRILKPRGKILLNQDDPETFDPAKMDIHLTTEQNNQRYDLHWQTKEFDPKTNTTISSEDIRITDQAGQLIQKNSAKITQRWWRELELEELCEPTDFKIQKLAFSENEESYFLLEKL